MTKNKTRALDILHYKAVDRLPAVHFGYWAELLQEWAEQGHIPRDLAENNYDGSEKDRELDRLLGWDHNWLCAFSGNNGLFPAFEYKELEVLPDGFIRIQNPEGLIERIRPGAGSIPAEDDYQLKDRKAFEELYKPKMQYTPARIDFEYFKKFNETKRDYPVGLHLGSVLGSIRNMLSVIGMSYMLCDDYDLLREIVDTYADMQYQCAKAVLETGAKFDFAHFWEDICFKNGPIVSVDFFRSVVMPRYKRIRRKLDSYGIDLWYTDCDGDVRPLLPYFLEGGINCLFPFEVMGCAHPGELLDRYPGVLRIMGGVDKIQLGAGREAIRRYLETLVPYVERGGYIPFCDHRCPPNISPDDYLYYLDLKQKMFGMK